ncbi:hypothetical protein [Phascolarctobacterium sp.]
MENQGGIMPVYSVNDNGNRSGSWGDGNGSFLWIFALLILLAWGGNGFGGFGGNGANGAGLQGLATRADINEGFALNGLQNGISGLRDGQFGIQNALCNGFNSVNSNIANLGYQMQSCCCETNRNIDAVRYENAKNTCDIVNAVNLQGQMTRDMMTQNVMQELRDQLQAAQLQLGNVAQTSNIINSLRPTPIPAYITCSPYQSVYGGLGSGCGNC